ncbi:FmdB family zinc ribbon protein [Micrococcus lylae]|uniref:FmdB family zinc ribbon protein n=1 Tax=Micrococcus lylae TaxID=1273 RepID=UPI000C7FCE83|nr:FmdB family zinc ribbon protein [Micrococcus lylae]WIK81151.1 zinc ribbon domain-containing protein [Micrococcus lylae]
MPTYAYRCKDCDHAFDIVQSFTDDSLTECPECGGTLRKQYGSVGVTFKGGGFYRTDSRNSGGSSSSEPSRSRSGSGSSSSSSSSHSGSGSGAGPRSSSSSSSSASSSSD